METDEPPSVLPPLYAAWLEQHLGGPIPPEREATCAECAMLRPDGAAKRSDERYFRAEVKCCSYRPNLPNFLVGQTLSDSDPLVAPGRATLERRIAGGVTVTPLGVHSGPIYTLLYRRSREVAFGRSLRLRCPFYRDEGGGRCDIWRHRNAVCATFFCRYVRGAIGQRFWGELLELLEAVEEGLSHWCLAELGADVTSLRQLLPRNPVDDENPLEPADIDEVADVATYRATWGHWLGREHEFYRECARLVGQLRWPDVARLCGARATLLATLVQAAYADLLSEELPAALVAGAFKIWELSPDRCCLTSYSLCDSLDAPRALLAALPYFDGRPWPEAVAAVAEGEGIKLDRSLVRKLVDFEILMPVDGTAATRPPRRSAAPPRRTPGG